MGAKTDEDQEQLEAMRYLLSELAPIYSASVESVAEALGITARHVQRLALEGTLPAPSRHGSYNLPGCVRAWGLHKRHVTIPTSFAVAVCRFVEARDVLEECVRRYPNQRPANYETAGGCLWPIHDLVPLMTPQRINLRQSSAATACALTGLALFAFEAAFPRHAPPSES